MLKIDKWFSRYCHYSTLLSLLARYPSEYWKKLFLKNEKRRKKRITSLLDYVKQYREERIFIFKYTPDDGCNFYLNLINNDEQQDVLVLWIDLRSKGFPVVTGSNISLLFFSLPSELEESTPTCLSVKPTVHSWYGLTDHALIDIALSVSLRTWLTE